MKIYHYYKLRHTYIHTFGIFTHLNYVAFFKSHFKFFWNKVWGKKGINSVIFIVRVQGGKLIRQDSDILSMQVVARESGLGRKTTGREEEQAGALTEVEEQAHAIQFVFCSYIFKY